MSEAVQRVANSQAQVEDTFLVHARFLDSTRPVGDPAPVPPKPRVTYTILLDRQGLRRMGIALSVNVGFQKPYRIEAIYAGTFRLSDAVADADVDEHWRQCAARLAPVILHPFLREVVFNLTSRSRSDGYLLPVIAFDGIKAEEITIPPVAEPVLPAAPAPAPADHQPIRKGRPKRKNGR